MKNKCNHIRFYGGYDGESFLGLATKEKAIDFFKKKLDSRYKEYLSVVKEIEENPTYFSTSLHNLKISFPFDEDLYENFSRHNPYIEFDFCPICGEPIKKGFLKLIIQEDITEYRNAFQEVVPVIKEKQNNKKEKNLIGYIYVIEIDGHYKIGISKNPKKRFGEYTRLYKQPKLIICEKIKGYDLLENELHNKFSEKREGGEWFRLDKNDIQVIKEEIDYIKKNGLRNATENP